MAKKRGATKKKGAKKQHAHVMTIPQLRKAFEHVETFVELHHKKPRKELVSLFQEEWKLTFKKEIDTNEAEAYVDHALSEIQHKNPKDRKHSGGAMALTGAPVLSETRPGLYISPGVNEGSYAQVPAYVDKGFWNPEQGRSYDPVPGQTHYPSATPYGLGSNRVSGGAKKNTRKKQKGGGFLDQFFMRPVFSYNPPPAYLDTVTTAALAKTLPQSPDPSQTELSYQSCYKGLGLPLGGVSLLRPSTTPIPTSNWFT
jgi:hypothetical protein